MWNWMWLLLLPIIILLLIEEVSQFIWRRYLKELGDRQGGFFIRTLERFKKMKQKYRKNPSH